MKTTPYEKALVLVAMIVLPGELTAQTGTSTNAPAGGTARAHRLVDYHPSAQSTNQPVVRAAAATKPQLGATDPVQMMKQFLGLGEEQAKKLEPVFKEHQNKMNALRHNTSLSRQERLAKLREIEKATDDQIKSVLTPAQADKWQRRLERAAAPEHQGTNTGKFH